MEKYRSINEYLESINMTREDLKYIISESALLLATDCAHNFDGEARETEKVAQPIYFLNEIIDNVVWYTIWNSDMNGITFFNHHALLRQRIFIPRFLGMIQNIIII